MQIINVQTTPIEEVVTTTIGVLRAGGLVIFPTETVYGAGVDATNQAAVDKLLAYKSRREGKPLSIAVPTQATAEQYVELNDQAKALYKQFLPGPVTVVSKSLGKVAHGVASEFGTVGVRIPNYPLLLTLLEEYQLPMTATSANASDKKRPYSIQDIFDGLSEKQKSLIDLVLDAGTLPKNQPSTVIDTTHSLPVVMRAGSVHTNATGSLQLTSFSETETQAIAGKLLLKHWNNVKSTGLVIGLDGVLGAGKTVFTKGVATFLNVKQPITSPTYNYMNEYQFERHGVPGTLYHLDLWKIESAEELERLEIPRLLTPNSVVIIEWWSQVQQWMTTIQSPLLTILLEDTGDQQRTITIQERSA